MFQRQLFQSIGDLNEVALGLSFRLVGHILRGPVRLSRTYYCVISRVRQVVCCRDHAVEPDRPAGEHAPASESMFMTSCEAKLVSQLYDKIGSALSLLVWFVYAVFYRFGGNARVVSFGAQLESASAEAFVRVCQVALLCIIFEGVGIRLLWLQARRVQTELLSRCVQDVVNSPVQVKVALVVPSVHIAQDIAVAFARPNLL